ncbi:MAG: preprotein translocase subunit SecG [Helicobacteraceae bacterium]|jgi:preprotein translocase subunit SecG|nr:preprotein translocase subunit SecG [Helicobacteraceae bacterium]
MTGILLISQIVLVVIITIAVLLQKSSSIGLGAYSGSNESVFGAKGPGSFLAKMTFFFGFLFILNTVTLGYFYAQESSASVVDNIAEATDVAAPAAPAEQEAPAVETNTSN